MEWLEGGIQVQKLLQVASMNQNPDHICCKIFKVRLTILEHALKG